MNIVSFDIVDLIQKESVVTHFQPIISLKMKKTVGLEALTRGVCPETGKIISPVELFYSARLNNCDIELDRLCRRKAIENFSKLDVRKDTLLFINLDGALLDRMDNISHSTTLEYARAHGVPAESVAVEIVESQIQNNENLNNAVQSFRKNGMFVVLDDFGALHSNLDRIVTARPDIIKIDRSLVDNVSENYYQQSIIRSIKDLAQKIGSLTLAEGVERVEDILTCYEMGIDLFQGYYFAKPMQASNSFIKCCEDKILSTTNSIKSYINCMIESNNITTQKNEKILDAVIDKVSDSGDVSNSKIFIDAVSDYNEIECIYLLNEDGIQVGPTYCNSTSVFKLNPLFSPSVNETDHSLKDYFYYINNLKIDRFYTDPYISLATGYLCRTMSKKLSFGGSDYILCIDFIEMDRQCEIT